MFQILQLNYKMEYRMDTQLSFCTK